MAAATGCSNPSYVNKGEGESGWLGVNEVVFQVHDAYTAAPPDCVAILPLTIKPSSQPAPGAEDAAKVRLSLYAHLATQSKRGVRLERIDHVLAQVKGDRKALGQQIKCAAVLEGEVTEYGSTFLGLYSSVSAGVDLKMVRVADGVVLWEGQHVAVSHGGSLPLDPVGLAMGLVDAMGNVRDEQILRVTDDLARRLVSTIPDNKVQALDDPAAEAPKATRETARPDDLTEAERLLADGDHAGAMAAADRAIAADPNRKGAWFLKGRVLMLDRDYANAEPAILKAVALDSGNVRYLNALGAVNAEKGALDRALAAYGMAIEADSANGFAWYNSAVIHFNAGNPADAADGFYGAGLAYLKTGDYAKAERALSELKDIAKSGVPVQTQIRTIEDSLSDLTRRKS
ncbi:MAG: tetratricopeptide repeat protein [Magnetospirillum sp.]|nr:tetratricopeptide repeat protein [Magnetospirillum sp.]